ncbi:MAG: DUF309 domain-containing protein [Armatimonadota bacterium]|nr:DUF309 domain-containing protein [Armatimonadota bacterium]MDR7403428.1 DUF309 domain-containing protein [Armatimonadota bacterium]
MSYARLKHLLSGLALEALGDPAGASWAPVACAYGELATSDRLAVPLEVVLERAGQIGRPVGYSPQETDAPILAERGLLLRGPDVLSLHPEFAPYLDYYRRQTSRLVRALVRMRQEGAGDALRRAAALLEAGLYFECHELLEGVWRATRGPERDFYHGLIQVAAAFYHFEKGNWHGARVLLDKGLDRLRRYPDTYLGVDLRSLVEGLRPWRDYFGTAGVRRRPDLYPALRFVA